MTNKISNHMQTANGARCVGYKYGRNAHLLSESEANAAQSQPVSWAGGTPIEGYFRCPSCYPELYGKNLMETKGGR